MSSASVTTATKGMFQIPTFDATPSKWPLWKQRVKAAMVARGWWSYMINKKPTATAASSSNSSSTPAEVKVESEEERNRRACALSALILALPDDLMSAYAPADVDDPSIVWNNLVNHFESNTRMNKSHLRNKLASTRMSGDTTYLAYYTELMTVVRTLQGMGEVVSNSEIMHHLLNGLSPDYQGVKLILQLSEEETVHTMHNVLTQHAERLQIENLQSNLDRDNSAFYFSQRGNGGDRHNRDYNNRKPRGLKECYTCKKPGHEAYDCELNKDVKKCTFCKYVGSHTVNECRKKKKAEAGGRTTKPDASTVKVPKQATAAMAQTVAEDSDGSEELFWIGTGDESDPNFATALHTIPSDEFGRASASDKTPRSPNSIRLTLDSGATIATAKNLQHLHQVRRVPAVRVKVANNQTVLLDQVGTLRVRTHDGSKTITIPDVYYWPECPVNLISVASLTRNQKEVLFSANEAIIRKSSSPPSGEPILRIPKRGNLYVIDLVAIVEDFDASPVGEACAMPVALVSQAAAASNPDPLQPKPSAELVRLWHNRLGHLGTKRLEQLVRSSCVRGLEALRGTSMDRTHDSMCHGCAVGKATRKSFSRLNSGEPAAEILDRMHADVKGPINVPTLGGKRYLLCLTDEKSRRSWGFLLAKKSDAAQFIIDLLTQLRIETGKTVRVFHTDNGGEFVNEILRSYFKREGIRHSTTTPETSNHNPIAERAFRTIFNTARAMLHHAGLPSPFWGHAVQTAIHLKNKTLTSVNGALTPEAIWKQQCHELNTHLRPGQADNEHADHRFTSEMKNLHVFGCNVYYHIQGQKALDARARRGVLLGYADEGRGYYQILDIESKKLVTRRDVRFDEDQFTFARMVVTQSTQSMGHASNPASAITLDVAHEDMDGDGQSTTHQPQAPAVRQTNRSVDTSIGVQTSNPYELLDPASEDSNSESEAELDESSARVDHHNIVQSDSAASSLPAARSDHGPPVTMTYTGGVTSDLPIVGPSTTAVTSPPQNAPTGKPEVVFDDVRPNNIVALGKRRQHSDVNYSDTKRHKNPRKPFSQALAAVSDPVPNTDGLLDIESKSLESEGESNDEIEDPEPDFTPMTWKQALSCKNARHWQRAAEDEIRGMQANQSYELVPRPTGPNTNVIDSKWVWKKKLDRWGRVKRFRARLVARGFKQIAGVDYFDTFAPVMRYKSLLILLAIAAERDYEIRHLDVPKAFLQAALEEAIYMEQPEGFNNGDKQWVWKLLKSVYGIKQAPNNWNDELNRTLLELGFTRLRSDSCIYVKNSSRGNLIILGVFVDDIIPIFSSADILEWKQILAALKDKYNIKDTGDASVVLGIRLTRNRKERTIKLDHVPYIAKMLKDFQMEQCNTATTPTGTYTLSTADCPASDQPTSMHASDRSLYQRIVGSLNYAAISVRPDIAFAVNTLARYMQNPGAAHVTAAKRVLRYLKGTAEIGIVLGGNKPGTSSAVTPQLTMWSDSDYANDTEARRSVTGYIIQVNGSIVSWSSKRQGVTAKSSCEAEYYAISAAASEAKWVSMFLRELLIEELADPQQLPNLTVLGKVDNTAAIAMSKNDSHHGRTKHIDIRHHHVREAIDRNQLVLEHVSSGEQLADILTKGLGRVQFERLRTAIMT